MFKVLPSSTSTMAGKGGDSSHLLQFQLNELHVWNLDSTLEECSTLNL